MSVQNLSFSNLLPPTTTTTPNTTATFCFSPPSPPYIKIPPLHHTDAVKKIPVPSPLCLQTTDEHIKTVSQICAVYASCEHQVCQNSFSGHAVMCPPSDFYKTSCLYHWAQLGINTPSEQDFIRRGSNFIHVDAQKTIECKDIDYLFQFPPDIKKE